MDELDNGVYSRFLATEEFLLREIEGAISCEDAEFLRRRPRRSREEFNQALSNLSENDRSSIVRKLEMSPENSLRNWKETNSAEIDRFLPFEHR